jgi:hypothetical protein
VLWVRFDDASEGRVDLSDIAGRGVFKAWDDPAVWSAVRVEPGSRTVTWPGEIDLDPDVLYSDVTGKPLPGYGEPNKAAG